MNASVPTLGDDGMILEGIVTTYNEDGTVNISPMGPIVDPTLRQFLFRPYRSSTTYKNLKRTRRGVFHITDDVMLFAQSAVGRPEPVPPLDDLVLTDTCQWFEFEVQSLDDSNERTEIVATTVAHAECRPFLGFNRAKHAVLEAAILATRVRLLPPEDIWAELARLESPVDKTASSAESEAFRFVQSYIRQNLPE